MPGFLPEIEPELRKNFLVYGLDRLFTEIDINSNGSLDLNEISNHLIKKARNVRNINIDIPLNKYEYIDQSDKIKYDISPIKLIKYKEKKDKFFILSEHSNFINLISPSTMKIYGNKIYAGTKQADSMEGLNEMMKKFEEENK